MMASTSTGRPAPAIRQMTVDSSVRPPTFVVNGDRDPAAMTGDGTHQQTSSGDDRGPGSGSEGSCLMARWASTSGDTATRWHAAGTARRTGRPGGPAGEPEPRRLRRARRLARAPARPGDPGHMESSGHYWMPLASPPATRQGVPVALVNPLAARYFAKSRLGRTKSDPADARSLAEMAMRDAPVAIRSRGSSCARRPASR